MKTKEGLWKLSPSGLYSYEDCKACFWVAEHIGKPPFTLPLLLNDAMDNKLKKRYDIFRREGKLPPEISHLKGIKLFENLDLLEDWRNRKTSLAYENKKDGYLLEGKLDEVFINDKGEYMPADYKSSGHAPAVDKQKYYRLQLHACALMLREHGYRTGNKAYLLHYFTKDRDNTTLNMEFDFHVDEVEINLPIFLETLRSMVKLLNGDFPGINHFCQKCMWAEKRKEH